MKHWDKKTKTLKT